MSSQSLRNIMHFGKHMVSDYTETASMSNMIIQHATPTAHTYQLQKAILEMKLVEPLFSNDDPWIDKIRTGDDMT